MAGFGFNVSKFGQKSGVDLNNQNLNNGGIKKANIDTKYHSIFDKVDKNKDGMLDNNEMADLRSQIDKDNNGYMEKNDAKAFLYGDDGGKLTYVDDKGKEKELKAEDLNQFLADCTTQATADDVKTAKKGDVDGKSAVTMEMNDGSQEIHFDDKETQSRKITTDSETGAVTTDYSNAKTGTLEKQEVVDGNKTIVTEFEGDGETPSTKVTTDKDNNSTETINYENGKPATKDVEKGAVSSHYTYDENGNERLDSQVKNKGNDVLEENVKYSYGEDGTTTAVSEKADDSQTTTIKDSEGNVTSETTVKDGKTNEVKYNSDGTRTETFSQPDKGYTQVDEYNADGKRTSKHVTNSNTGADVTIEYDGKGNTLSNVNAGESLEMIAQKAGCSVNDLKKLNPGLTDNNIQAGQKIVVPGERNVNDKFLNSRQSVEEAKDKGNAAEVRRQERAQAEADAKAREEQQLKDMGLRNHNGEGKKVQAKFKNGSREMTQIGEAGNGRILAKDDKGNIYTVAHDGTVLDSNYAAKTDTGTAQGKQELAKAESEVAQMRAKLKQAKADFNNQMRKDGVFADTADGISKLWNNHLYGDALGINTGNTASQVREDFDKMDNILNDMDKALARGDMKEYNRLKKELNSDSRLKNINSRVADYNKSQNDGAEVVKTGVVAAGTVAAGIATGGASLAAQAAVAGGAAAVGTLVTENGEYLSAGMGQSENRTMDNFSENGGTALDNMGNTLKKSAVNGVVAAVGTGAAGKVGNAIMGKTGATSAEQMGRMAHAGKEVAEGATDTVVETGLSAVSDVAQEAAGLGSGASVQGSVTSASINSSSNVISHNTSRLAKLGKAAIKHVL